MDKLRKIIIIEEFEKITMKNVADPVKFWALYATTFYERLFSKINSSRQLEKTYQSMIPKMKRPDDKKALEFFYQLRKQELAGTFKWEQKMENKIREIIREEIRSILSETLGKKDIEAVKDLLIRSNSKYALPTNLSVTIGKTPRDGKEAIRIGHSIARDRGVLVTVMKNHKYQVIDYYSGSGKMSKAIYVEKQ
jgi:hypothetical protein